MFKKFEKGHHYKQKMASSLCFLRKPLSVFGPLLILAAFSGYGFLSVVITSILLTLSTLLFKFSKQKANLEEKDEILIHPEDEKSLSAIDTAEDVDIVSEAELIPEDNESTLESEEKAEEVQESEQCLARTSVSEQSESLGRSSTSEDSEVLEWMRQDSIFRSPDWSDGSISDEESLIEIELPGGHFVGNKEEKEEYSKRKFADFDRLGYSFLKQQHGLLELFQELNEMNEEENLIEIDISMGSIKCPRFEIEA